MLDNAEVVKGLERVAKGLERAGIDFLNTELELCVTFLERAQTAADDDVRQRNVGNAVKGYKTILYFAAKKMLRPVEESAIRLKLNELKAQLANLGVSENQLR